MPKIELEKNSPEYLSEDANKPFDQICDFKGCSDEGCYKAPKGRNSQEYHHFCLAHVRDYNSSWDYFDGMSPREAQDEVLRSIYGDRPTWKHEDIIDPVEKLRRQAKKTYNYNNNDDDGMDHEQRRRQAAFTYHNHSPEYKAMTLLELEPPLDLDKIKKRYKELVKKHHPDRNGGSVDAQERIKEINTAYATLKTAFERYEKIAEKES